MADRHMENRILIKQEFDEERALYGERNLHIQDCRFAGPADGESALKEAASLTIERTSFQLRYPLWHVQEVVLDEVTMEDTCRAALWYDEDIKISNSYLGGIKAVRECKRVELLSSEIESAEFGWFSSDLTIKNSSFMGEYPFLKAKHLLLEDVTLQGKYSFQYVEDMEITNSYLDTKDAFWHSRNVTVRDSIIKGEYLAWYSENLTLIHCTIIGTQPLCYAKNLVLEDCTMIDTDLAFEKSDVQATIHGSIDSVKNPASGYIEADAIKEIIIDTSLIEPMTCDIKIRKKETLEASS